MLKLFFIFPDRSGEFIKLKRYKKTSPEKNSEEAILKSGDDLSSRSVSRQVLSARESLTSVFGMGTGGSFLPLSPLWLYIRLSPHTYKLFCVSFSFLPFPDSVRFGPPDFVSETLSSSFPKTYNYTAISLSKKLSFIFQLVKIIESS